MTSSKNYTEVIIDGKVFTLSGFESEEYLQQVSTYLNHKISECASSEGYGRQSAETRNILLALNIADDYFKEKKQSIALESDVEEKDKEMYDLKKRISAARTDEERRTLYPEYDRLNKAGKEFSEEGIALNKKYKEYF